jgi:N4-gp56 family major capsid protein
MPLTTYGDISPRTAAYAAAEMLKRAQPYLVLQQFGQVKPIPANSSTTIKFRRYEALGLATTALTEGVTPQGSSLTTTDVQATLQQYGDFITLTDVIKDTHEDPVFKEAQGVTGEQAAQTVEAVLFGILKAGTNVFYSNGTARSAVNTAFTLNDQRKVTRGFKRQNARYRTTKLSSTVNFNTENVAPSYIAVIHPDLETTIRGFAGFKDVIDYGSMTPYEFEIGAVEDVRYIRSTVISAFTDLADVGGAVGAMIPHPENAAAALVYPILFFASDAFAVTPLKGKNAIRPMVLNPDTPREGDPIGQRGYVGWKTWFTACILNQLWMARFETAVTELT